MLNLEAEQLNVEEIMRKVRERIEKRKKTRQYSNAEPLLTSSSIRPGWSESLTSASQAIERCRAFSGLRVRRDVETSKPRIIRASVLKIRRILQAEVRWGLEPIATQQEQFNREVVGALESLTTSVSGALEGIEGQIDDLKTQIDDLKTQIGYTSITDWERVVFHEDYRGTFADIKNRFVDYVNFFRGCQDVVDLGCGRGEFLELMREASIAARGVELNKPMVELCKARGLDVVEEDAVAFLKKQAGESIGGIFAAHLIEHLHPGRLVELVRNSYAKLKKGGILVFETPNPENLYVFANSFYTDITHVRPIHPKLLKFLLSAVGFSQVKILYRGAVPIDQKLEDVKNMGGVDPKLLEILSRNFQRVNQLIFGDQDYAAVATK